MKEKLLGKIESAEFGMLEDYPFLLGLKLWFSLGGGSQMVSNGLQYTVNMEAPNSERQYRTDALHVLVYDLLNGAKVRNISDLSGAPVEVEIENGIFSGFRILTEVL